LTLNEIYEIYRKVPNEGNLTKIIINSQNLIYSIALNIAKHNQDAEDITQEVLIKVIQNANILPKDVNFIAWVNKVSMNAAINFYHQKKRSNARLSGYKEENIGSIQSNEDETIAIVYQHLALLDESEQSMVINKHIHQMTFAQLSNIYKMPIPTIQSKINNILNKIKLSIEKSGFASVSIGLTSTLNGLQSSSLTSDILSKLKSYYPKIYPKSTHSLHVISTSNMIVICALALVLIYVASILINNQNDFFVANDIPPTNQLNSKNNQEQISLTNSNKETIENIGSEDQKEKNQHSNSTLPISHQENESQDLIVNSIFAGQLLDSETNNPIAGAKLEIWDIYTFQKTETVTDAEGKYNIPKDLDKTFFYYLKFIKEDYAFKQTFQHFGTSTTPKIYMNKGKKIICKIQFLKNTNGEMYFGSYINLNSEQHLTANQKTNLLKIFNCFLENAPLEVFTYKKITLENVSFYNFTNSILEQNANELLSTHRDFAFYNFGVLYEDGTLKGSYGLVNGDASISYNHSKNQSKLYFLKNNTPVPVKNLKIIDKHTKKEFLNKNENNENNEFYGSHWNNIFKHEGIDYYCQFGSSDYSSIENTFTKMMLAPYSDIYFEPSALGSNFNNSQAIIGNNYFSKKSKFNKVMNAKDLAVFDMFFEEMQLNTNINISFGETIDVNHELNNTLLRNIRILIYINEIPLKDTWINIIFSDNDDFEDQSEYDTHNLKLNSNGYAEKIIPNKTKKLKISFVSNKISYTKIVDLKLIANDEITINYVKRLKVHISNEMKLANINAEKKHKEYFNYNLAPNNIYLFNENSSIKMPFADSILYLEKDIEYTLTDSGSSIKTNINQLKAFKSMSINSRIDSVEIKPVSESDYTTFQISITDNMGNSIENAIWMVLEDSIANRNIIKSIYHHNHFYPTIEFLGLDNPLFSGKDKKLTEDFIIGDDAIKKKQIEILNNRKYLLCVRAEGYVNYMYYFTTRDGQFLSNSIILKKINSVKYKGENKSEFFEITKLLKKDDIIFEYNNIRINNLEEFKKACDGVKQENIQIKLIRNNIAISLIAPAIQIFGVVRCPPIFIPFFKIL